MIEQLHTADYLASMLAENGDLREHGSLQFDGSQAWEAFGKALGAGAVVMAKRLKESGEVGPPSLPDHLGVPDQAGGQTGGQDSNLLQSEHPRGA
jgi:hypothetical protein